MKIDKLDTWKDEIKHSINAAFAQFYDVKRDDDEDEENEDMIKTEREENMKEMEMSIVIDKKDRNMIILWIIDNLLAYLYVLFCLYYFIVGRK